MNNLRSIPMNEFEPELEPILEECTNCKVMVPECEISPETDNECDDCKKIERCMCGDPIEQCTSCDKSLLGKWREWLINKLENLI